MKTVKTLVVLLSCCIIVLFFLNLKLQWVRLLTLIRVAGVYCKTQYGPCTQEEEKRLENLVGQDFLRLDTVLVATKISESDFRIRRALVEKVFPNSLNVILEKRKAIVGIAVENGVFLIDGEGMVIALEKTGTLPVLYGLKSDMVVGERASQEVVNAARILSLVNKAQGANTAYLERDSVRVILANDISSYDEVSSFAYFSLDSDVESRVGALQLILSHIRMDEKLPKTIDLRYSKPVLRY